jgi:hypothetical protein
MKEAGRFVPGTRNAVAGLVVGFQITPVGAAGVGFGGVFAYAVTSLVSDLKGVGAIQDPVLQNAWGVAFTPAGSPFWIADNATG